jgi:hypothetical protein
VLLGSGQPLHLCPRNRCRYSSAIVAPSGYCARHHPTFVSDQCKQDKHRGKASAAQKSKKPVFSAQGDENGFLGEIVFLRFCGSLRSLLNRQHALHRL